MVAAITVWNTVYLERAVTLLGKSQAVDTGLLQHVSPLGWEHVGLTGDYLWHSDKRVAKGLAHSPASSELGSAVLSVRNFPFLEVPPSSRSSSA